MNTQKFQAGDLVRVATSKELGPTMIYFESDCDAVVLGSYNDQFGCGDVNNHVYTLLLLDSNKRVSWYHEKNLTLIKKGEHHDRLCLRPTTNFTVDD